MKNGVVRITLESGLVAGLINYNVATNDVKGVGYTLQDFTAIAISVTGLVVKFQRVNL